MLYQVSIRNVAIIESVEISFSSGLNILTGETGAGKSILIDSLNLVLGARTNRELIRRPADSARVEAVFGCLNQRTRDLLTEWDISQEDDELILTREIWENGRSASRVNGNLVTLAQVRELASALVDVHGQHEYRYLLDPTRHTHILDSFAGPKASSLLEELKGLSASRNELRHRIDTEFGDDAERARRMDILRYQISEIEGASVKPGEDDELEKERTVMQNAERLREAVGGAYSILSEGSGDDCPGAGSMLEEASRLLERAGRFDAELMKPAEQLTQIGYELEDVISLLRDLSGRFDFDEYRMEEIETRLSLLKSLKRKYGGSLEAVLEFAEDARKEYERYENAGDLMEQLNSELSAKETEWKNCAGKLTKLRQKTSEQFSALVLAQMADLGMPDASFEIRLTPSARTFSPDGAETAAFWLSANKGEAAGPLDKVASGGELSRILLALKAVAAATDDIPTMIFDEIDSGISGSMARMVGQKLVLIASRRQVICITHTAQIAAMGDSHYLIRKVVEGERTHTRVTELPKDERYTEIGRLVGGDMTGSVSETHAKEMLRWCEEYKEKVRSELKDETKKG